MVESGLGRNERREFWREFAKRSQDRERLVLSLAKRIRRRP
jgi:hypothetical protein